MRCVALLFVLLVHSVCGAETIQGTVTRIAEGDSLTIRDSAQREFKIRLAGIDAPEREQPYYETSRQNLAGLAYGKLVTVKWYKRDRYGRLVGTAVAATDKMDLGLAQVRAGHAWWFKRDAKEQTPFERSRYETAEREAQTNKRGLWRTGKPVPPWEWRAARGLPD